MSARNAAALLVAQGETGSRVVLQNARVTAVNVGPPLSLDLLVDDRWAVADVPYLNSYATPAVNDAVYVLNYGTGRRIVLGEGA